jgi:hypothetical protein
MKHGILVSLSTFIAFVSCTAPARGLAGENNSSNQPSDIKLSQIIDSTKTTILLLQGLPPEY